MSIRTLRPLSLLLIVLGVVLWSGCYVLSLNPLVAPGSAILEEHLSGKWQEGKRALEVKSNSDGCYTVEYTESDGRGAHLEGCLGIFDGELVLDLEPDGKWLEEHIPEGLFGFLVTGHTYLRVRASDDALEIQTVDSNWLRKAISRKKSKLTTSTSGSEGIVLTGSTEELERFFSRNAANTAMWATDSEHSFHFQRIGPATN